MTAKSWQRIATWTLRLLLSVLLLLVLAAVTVLMILPKAVHGEAMTVLTGSMTPTIPVGSIVLVRPVDPGTLHVGDVATYQKSPGAAEYITHRIVKINTKTTPVTFTFKGDANRGADMNPVPSTAIRGKVWFHVSHLGSIRDMVHTKNGVTGIAMILLAGYALAQGTSVLRDRRAGSHDSPQDDALRASATNATSLYADVADHPTLIHAVIPRSSLDGLTPRVFGLLIGGLLLDETDEDITLLIAQPAGRAAVTVEMLRRFEATRIDCSDPDPEAAETAELEPSDA
jgi:signal peptidase